MFADANKLPYVQLGMTARGKACKALNSARSLLNAGHPAHSHLAACAKALGFEDVADRSEDNSGKPSDFTSPGTIAPSSLRAPDNTPKPIVTSPSARANGSSGPIPGPGGKAAKRDEIVQDLYKKAGSMKDRVLKAKVEALAVALDSLDLRDVEKMSAVDLECLAGQHGEQATRAAMKKAQAVGVPFRELAEGISKGDRRTFEGRHGF